MTYGLYHMHILPISLTTHILSFFHHAVHVPFLNAESRSCPSCSSNSIHTCLPTDSLSHLHPHLHPPSIASDHVPHLISSHVMPCHAMSILCVDPCHNRPSPSISLHFGLVPCYSPLSANLIIFVEGVCPYMAMSLVLPYTIPYYMSCHVMSYTILYIVIIYHCWLPIYSS